MTTKYQSKFHLPKVQNQSKEKSKSKSKDIDINTEEAGSFCSSLRNSFEKIYVTPGLSQKPTKRRKVCSDAKMLISRQVTKTLDREQNFGKKKPRRNWTNSAKCRKSFSEQGTEIRVLKKEIIKNKIQFNFKLIYEIKLMCSKAVLINGEKQCLFFFLQTAKNVH